MRYILDTNVIIDAWKEHYPISIIPKFWTGLLQAVKEGNIIICQSIYEEIAKGTDDLKDWFVHSVQKEMIESDSEPEVVEAYRKTINEINNPEHGYTAAALEKFADCGDSFLIAHALAHGYSLITLEVSKTEKKSSVKIPDACQLVNVNCSKIKSILHLLNL